MTRFFSLLALSLTLSLPAVASDDDGVAWAEDDLEGLDVKKKDKKKADELPDKAGPSDLGEEPEEEFDLLDAPDAEGPVDDFEFDEEEDDFDMAPPKREKAVLGDFGLEDDEDDIEIEGVNEPAVRKTASKPALKGPGPVSLQVAGKEPLADNYPLTVIAVDRDAVVVELPILVARSRVGVESGFQIIAEVNVGNDKVAQVAQTVTPSSLAEFGPSFAYIKVLAPVMENQGEIQVIIKRAKLDGSGAETLFTRSTPYSLQ